MMEGRGESIVTVVQSMNNVHLAVTVMKQRCGDDHWINRQTRGLALNCGVQNNQTCTEDLVTTDHASQSNDRYTSCYKSHCNTTPSSSPGYQSEFPPLRTHPCRADTDAFASSLRKYPRFSPERQPSTDLVESLLLYTQAKNLLKKSSHLKRNQSQKSKEFLNEKNLIRNKISKNLQTYTRSHKSEIPTKDEGADTKKYKIFNARNIDRLSGDVHSIEKDDTINISNEDNPVEYTYDYLKSGNISPSRGYQGSSRSPEVRYLTDVTRYIRDAIRQMCDDSAVIECPSMRSRYNQHQTQCQKRKSDVQTGPDSTNSEVQATSSKCTRGVSYSAPPIRTCSSPPRFCCFCRKRMPCACKVSRLSKSSNPRFSEQQTNFQKRDQSFGTKIKESIFGWLKEIPVYANESPADKTLRAKKIKMLTENLNKLVGDDNFGEKSKTEIDKCVASLPMWCPTGSDENMFRNKIANNLFEKIKGIPENDDNSSPDESVFEKKILEWLDGTLELSGYIERKHVKTLAKKLDEIKSKGLKDEDFMKQMQEEIKNWLGSVLLEECVNVDMTLRNELAENLANYLIHLQESKKHKRGSKQDDLQQTILEKLSDIIEECNLNLNSNEKGNITNEIANILTRNIDVIKPFKTDKIKEEIVAVLKAEVNLPDEKAKELADIFIKITKSIFGLNSDYKQITASSTSILKSDAKKSVSSPIASGNEVNKDDEFGLENREHDIKSSITDIIADQILRGIDNNKARAEMYDLYQNAHLTEEQTEDVCSSLIGLTKDLSIILKNDNSEEVPFRGVRKLSKSLSSHDFSFHLDKDAMSTMISPIGNEDFSTTEDTKYAEKLERVIDSWINELPTDLNVTGGIDFKNALVKDLVRDIIDRKKYLQLNPEAKTSDAEELEHLKYQVFRWLHKVLDVDNLTTIMPKTALLMAKIKAVSVPMLVNHPDEIKKKKETRNLESNDSTSLQNTITSWFEDIPSEFYTSSDKSYHQQMINELANKIHNLQTSKPNPEIEIRNEIFPWLRKMVKESNMDKLNKTVDKLIYRLTNKNTDESNSILTKDRNEFDEDSVNSLINSLTSKKVNDSPSILTQGDLQKKLPIKRDKILTSNNEDSFKPLATIDSSGYLTNKHDEIVTSHKEDKIKYLSTFDTINNLLNKRDEVLTSNKEVNIRSLPIDPRKYSPNKRDENLISNTEDSIRSLPTVEPRRNLNKVDIVLTPEKGDKVKLFPSQAPRGKQSKRDELQTSNKEDQIRSLPTADPRRILSNKRDEPITPHQKKNLSQRPDENLISNNEDHFRSVPTDSLRRNSPNKRDNISMSNNKFGIRPLITIDPKRNSPNGRDEVPTSNNEDDIKSPSTIDPTEHSPNTRVNLLTSSDKNKINSLPTLDPKANSSNKSNKRDEITGSKNGDSIRSTPAIDSRLNSSNKRDATITSSIENVIKILPIDPNENSMQMEHLNTLIGDLITRVKELTKQYDPSSPEFKQIIKEEIKMCLQTFSLEGLKMQDNESSKQKPEEHLLSVQFPVENGIRINESESLEPTLTIQHSVRNLFDEGESVENTPVSKTNRTSRTLYIDTDDVIKQQTTNYIQRSSLDTLKNVNSKSVTEVDRITSFISNVTKGKSLSKPQHSKALFIEEKVVEEPTTRTRQVIPSEQIPETEEVSTSKPISETKEIITSEAIPEMGEITENTFNERESFMSSKTILKTAMDILYESIENWCEELPLPGNTAEENETDKIIKQNLIHKLMLKITEMNMDPEIFNDELLYEDLLKDEIENLISTLPIDTELKTEILSLIPKLIKRIKEPKQKLIKELLVKAYKKNLRDTISKTLPPPVILSCNKQASFEVLKENLADAFVNLNYSIDNEELKKRFRDKIFNEINRFCKDYLRTCPGSPIDTRKLNHNLYNALAMVPVPGDESMIIEVEQLRLKDVINDWIKELPLRHISGAEELQMNKMVSILTKRIYDLEKNNESNLGNDYEDQMEREILRWMKKIPLKTTNNMNELSGKLITRLKNTELSRKLDTTTTKDSLDSLEETTCPYRKLMLERKKLLRSSCECTSQNMPSYPTSTLNTEEKAHLQKIKERSSVHKTCRSCRDASVSPLPIDACCQTDNEPCIDHEIPEIVCPNSRTPPCEKTSQVEISPNVIIKEYLWDSTHSLRHQKPCQPHSMTFQRLPTQNPKRHASLRNSEPCSSLKTPHKHTLPCKDSHPCTSTSRSPRTFINSRDSCCRSPKTAEKFSYVEEEYPAPCPAIGGIPNKKICGSLDDAEENFPDRISANVDDQIPKVSRYDQIDRRRKCIDFNLPLDDHLDTDYLRHKCNCRSRTLLKCRSKKHRDVCYRQTRNDDLKFCPKCCGQRCPYPSYLYFR